MRDNDGHGVDDHVDVRLLHAEHITGQIPTKDVGCVEDAYRK
jgi:hypothetical protein